MRKSSAVRLLLISTSLFIFYLMSLPQMVAQLVPCLKLSPGATYTWVECHVTLALDWYVQLAIAGLALSVFVVFTFINRPKLVPSMTLALVFTVAIILSYYLYIPRVETAVRRAPIIIMDPSKY